MAPETEANDTPAEGTTGNVSQSREDFEPNRGTVPRELDVAEDEHPIKDELGGEYRHTLSAHEGTVGERFAFRYSRAEAFIREYLANAETGLIRRSRHELRQYDSSTYDSEWFGAHSIPELFDEVRDVVGYYPVIESHSAPRGSQRARWEVEDNGVGVSVEEFKAMRELGLSPSHGEGKQLGSFGQGVMSVFNAVGKYGELTLTTWSVLDGANYRERFRIREFNDLPGQRDEYGTTWTIPSFSDEAKDMDVDAAVEEFADAMYAPVLHHSYDEQGVETKKEEYTYTPLADMVDDDEPAFVYEDDYIEAVMSSSINDPETLLVTMPIERSCDTGSKFAPFKFHVRIKEESGLVYHSGSDGPNMAGLVPVEDRRYENEQISEKGAIHWDQSVPGDLFAYNIDDSDHYHVPVGVDDELVDARDDLRLWPRKDSDDFDHPATDAGFNPVVVDGPHEGDRIVSEQEWESIETDVADTFVPRGDLELFTVFRYNDDQIANPPCDVKLPEPVDDRDRLKEHDGSLFDVVSARLRGVLDDHATVLFERLRDDGFSAWYNFDAREREVFTVVYDEYIHPGSEPSPQVVMGKIETLFGITMPQDVCEQLTVLSRQVEFAPRNCSRPNKKGGRRKKTINHVLQEAGTDGDVYMGATVHAGKAQLAWAIHDDNQVIAVDSASAYDEYETLFGWTPLRSLSLHNIKETYDVDDKTAELLERDRSDRTSNGGGVSIDDLDAATREIKLRTRKKRHYKSSTPKEVGEQLNGDSGYINGSYEKQIRHLLVYPETEHEGVETGSELCVGSIGRTVVPKYVSEFLETVDRCYVVNQDDNPSDIIDQIRSNMSTVEIETIDLDPFLRWDPNGDALTDTSPDINVERKNVSLDDAGEETICIMLPDRLEKMVTGESDMADSVSAIGTIVKSIAEDGSIDEDATRISFISNDVIDQSILTWKDPTRPDDLSSDQAQLGIDTPTLDAPRVVKHKSVSSCSVDSTYWKPDSSVVIDIMLPEDEFNRDSDAWKYIIDNNRWSIKKRRNDGKAIVDLFHRMAELTGDDEPTLPQ